jgi:hypothetical protein
MPYQGKPVHLLGDLLEIPHVVNREERIIQQIIGDNVLDDRRLSPDLPRGTVNLIGGELDVEDPRLRMNRTPQLLHHYSIGYHLCHMNYLAMKAYPCKHNQEHKQE